MHPKLRSISSKEVERILRKHGFTMVRSRGSHRQFVGFIHGRKRRVTVVADQKSFKPKTLNSMIRQSGFTEDEWINSI